MKAPAPLLHSSDAGYPAWLRDAGAPVVVGNASLLAEPAVAVLASRRCSPALFFAAEAWALGTPGPVASGFHTAVEAEVLHARLRAGLPVVVCPARSVAGMRVRPEHRAAFDAGRLAYASSLPEGARRASEAHALARNRLVVALAHSVLVVHAAPGSRTMGAAARLDAEGRALFTFDHPTNAALVALGATPLPIP